ncbi:MAG: hypothetical protein ACI9G1_005000, partial [Pirellulaceae bacterium]
MELMPTSPWIAAGPLNSGNGQMRNWLWIVALVLIGVGILVFPCTGPRKMIVATVLIFLVLKIQTLVDYSSRRGRPSVRDQLYWFV